MKKIIVGISLVFLSIHSFSQIQVSKPLKKVEVGKVAPMGSFVAELYYYVTEENDTTYSLMYKNREYSSIIDIQHISFSSEGNTLNELYKVLQTFFTDENKDNKDYKIPIKLGESNIIISNNRQMGFNGVFISAPVGYFMLNQKQIDKLFGKSK